MRSAPSSQLFIGLDLGTSGCRGVTIDATGATMAEAAVDLPAPRRDGPAVEQDPWPWWEATLEVLDAIPRVTRRRVRALAIDGTSATLLVTDAAGRPLSPALMYNDSRARAEANRVAAVAPPESAARGPHASLAKLLYLQSRYPQARHALHQADWVAGRLCGRCDASDENNALKLGYDPAERHWPGWLDRLGVDRRWLPRVVPPGTPYGRVTSELTRRLGLRADTLVVAGTTDSVAAFLATGADRTGEAVTSLGSTLVIKVLSERPVFAPEYGVYSHRLGRRWLAGGASNSGGAVLTAHFSSAEIAALTRGLRPERPTGLDYYPLISPGERFPVNDPHLAPRIEPRPADDRVFFQALLEGIATIERRGYRLLAELGAPYPISVRSAGGGAANGPWTEIRARLLGVPILEATHREAAYGSALLARAGVIPYHRVS